MAVAIAWQPVRPRECSGQACGSDARSVWRLGAALGAAGDARRLRPRLLEVAFRALGRTRESGRELRERCLSIVRVRRDRDLREGSIQFED